MNDELRMTPTGKAIVLVELEEHGPIEWRINDKQIVLELIRVILNESEHQTTVNSYNKKEEKKMRDMLNF